MNFDKLFKWSIASEKGKVAVVAEYGISYNRAAPCIVLAVQSDRLRWRILDPEFPAIGSTSTMHTECAGLVGDALAKAKAALPEQTEQTRILFLSLADALKLCAMMGGPMGFSLNNSVRTPVVLSAPLTRDPVRVHSQKLNIAWVAARLSHHTKGSLHPADYTWAHKLSLLKRLKDAGGPHAKALRCITYEFIVDAPLYWWSQMMTYRVGCWIGSSMLDEDKYYPEGTIDSRVVTLSHETAERIILQRQNHRLPFWQSFCHDLQRHLVKF